ncbi:Zinc finger protein 484-like, partial [Plakobranchus ocellatus]
MAAAAAASSAVRAAAMSQAAASSTAGHVTSPYPTHLVPRPMFQGLPLSSGAAAANTTAVPGRGINSLGDALALRRGLGLNDSSGNTSTNSAVPSCSKTPHAPPSPLPSTLSSTTPKMSTSSDMAMALQPFPLGAPPAGLSSSLGGPPPAPHPALLLPGRPFLQVPPLDEEQLRYLSLAQIQAANQAHLAGEVAKLKQQPSSPFLTRNYLELAMLVCNTFRGKLFPCPHCRYVTDRRNNLKRHVATMHQACDKQLECCGVRFSTKASLREHITIFHHNGYSCPFCGRRFCRKALLKRHLSVHSGQKDYTCPSCDYATSHKSNLERHKRIHARLHLMGADASGLAADIDEEEIRRMEEEEEEEDRRRRRQAASMMMMLDEDDDDVPEIDDVERTNDYHHRHKSDESTLGQSPEIAKSGSSPWSPQHLLMNDHFKHLRHKESIMGSCKAVEANLCASPSRKDVENDRKPRDIENKEDNKEEDDDCDIDID